MDFETRKRLIKEAYPQIKVEKLPDHPCNKKWSEGIDSIVNMLYANYSKTLYGSRDSFKDCYFGPIKVESFPAFGNYSGTEARKKIVDNPCHTEQFREGIIFANQSRYPTSYQTVDTAVLDENSENVLLARKETDDGWRFIGGFVDPTDENLESAAKRETMEETGMIETDDYVYLGSTRVDDFRYRGQKDGIMTTLFRAKYIFGAPRPTDDIVELAWHSVGQIDRLLIDNHKKLGQMLISNLT